MFLDLLFPKKCIACKKIGSYICDNCFSYLTFDAKNTCLVCDRPSFDGLTHLRCKKRHGIDGCFSSIYHNKTAQNLISRLRAFLTELKMRRSNSALTKKDERKTLKMHSK